MLDDRTRAYICGLSNESLARFLVTDGVDSEAAACASQELSRRDVVDSNLLLIDARAELASQHEFLQRVNNAPFGFWDRVIWFSAGVWIVPLPFLFARVIAAERSEAGRARQIFLCALLGFGTLFATVMAMMVYEHFAAPVQLFR